MSSVVETTDVGTTLALLSAVRGVTRIRPRGDRAGMRLVQDTVGPVGIDRMTFGMDFDADVRPTNLLIVGQVSSGTVGFRADGTDRWYVRGDVYLVGQAQRRYTSMNRAEQHDQAVIDPVLLGRVADTGPGRVQPPVRFTGFQAVSAQAAQAWKDTFAYVRHLARADRAGAAQPLFAANAARLLIATALHTFPNNALAAPTAGDRHDSHPVTLRRSIAFIDEHADHDVAIADIAAAARVSVRAVQGAFRRHLDMTPMEYLRRVRLDHAHRDLRQAGPGDEVTVSGVAYRWGFANPSRFAASYRQAYGVTPSVTLRN